MVSTLFSHNIVAAYISIHKRCHNYLHVVVVVVHIYRRSGQDCVFIIYRSRTLSVSIKGLWNTSTVIEVS